MTSLQLRFAYQRQAVFLNLHYAAETWCQTIRMTVCVCLREAKQLEKYERLLNLVSIDTTERLLVTSPRGGMQGICAGKAGSGLTAWNKRTLCLLQTLPVITWQKRNVKYYFFACQYTLSRAYITWSRAWSDFITRAVKFAIKIHNN